MKTISQVIDMVVKSPKANWDIGYWDLRDMFWEELGYLDFDEESNFQISEAIQIYHVNGATWMCTDTWVGLSIIYFKGDAVGIISQSARKNDQIIEWFDRQYYHDFIAFVQSVSKGNRNKCRTVSLSDEVPEDWFDQKWDHFNSRPLNIDL